MSNSPLKIKVIIGSTRQGRFSEKPAHWISEEAKLQKNVEVEILDLREYPMPFYDDSVTPSGGIYSNEIVKQWASKIKDGDAFIIVSPEYNHSTSAVLKNALDSIYPEWNRKAVGFVSYGGAGGARAIEHLRQIAIELQMMPIRSSIHIPGNIYVSALKEPNPTNIFNSLKEGHSNKVNSFFEDLIWAGQALKAARIN